MSESPDETPPVPPQDYGGDERIGWWVTGVLGLVVGWGGAVLGNLALHRWAPAAGWSWGPVWIGPTMGPYAWVVLGVGFAAGLFGIVLLHLARTSRPGAFVLPGYDY